MLVTLAFGRRIPGPRVPHPSSPVSPFKVMQAFPINPKGIYVRPAEEKIEKHVGFHPQPRHVGPFSSPPHSPSSRSPKSSSGKIEAHHVELVGDEESPSSVPSHPLPPGEMKRANSVPSRPVLVEPSNRSERMDDRPPEGRER